MKSSRDLHHSVCLAFAGNQLRIQTESTLVVELAQFLFGHHLQNECDEFCPAIEVVFATDGGFQLMVDGQLVAIALNEDELPVVLMQLAQRQLVFGESRCAMLHAALLIRNGCGFLLPAAAGSGKTTLAAWLLGHGFDLVSDELSAASENGDLDGFTRPLNIKRGSEYLVNSFDWMGAPLSRSRRSNGVTLVPWERCAPSKLTAKVILCPSYDDNASFNVEALSRGRCATELLGSLLNARNLPKHGLTLVSRLAGSCPSYRVAYSRLEDVSIWLEELHGFHNIS